MVTKLTLEKASNIVSQISLLDAKMNSLLETINKTKDQVESNKNEIKKRMGLEQTNITLEEKIRQLEKEHADIKGQIAEKALTLTEAGWVIPMPKSDGAKGSVSM